VLPLLDAFLDRRQVSGAYLVLPIGGIGTAYNSFAWQAPSKERAVPPGEDVQELLELLLGAHRDSHVIVADEVEDHVDCVPLDLRFLADRDTHDRIQVVYFTCAYAHLDESDGRTRHH
jgi:hypothetical protein